MRAMNLPGLKRLLEVASRHGVPIETQPAGLHPPRVGDRMCGMLVDPLLAAAPMVTFPYGVPEIIAKDKLLMGMIREGRFDRWMYETNKTGWRDKVRIESTKEWIHRLLQ